MKKETFNFKIITILLSIVSLLSCNDKWDQHYAGNSGEKSELNLYDYIQSQPDLSIFTQMIQVAGYDTILNKPQTYTIWAPVNAGLINIDLSDTATVSEIVKNHITRFSHPTSGLTAKTIYMLDKKFLTFRKTDTGFTFGGKILVNSNIATSNGILHLIDGYVNYQRNLWEFIGKTPGLDSLRMYLFAQSSYEFDLEESIEIGTNENGNAVYDSIVTFSNPILDKIGDIYLEDSVYTALLPNNDAWTKVYNKIKNNYKTLEKDGGATQQRLNTQWAIVRNLIFRNKISDPYSLDSLRSTTGTVFQAPGYLFDGATPSVLSNGLAYITDSIRFKAAESWQQEIKIEAENSTYGRSNLYSTLYVRSGLGSAINTSGGKYLVCEPTTVSNSTMNSATFPIPNTLSGKYNIYCVFLPSSIVNPENIKRYKTRFYFSYLNNQGIQVTDAAIDVNNVVGLPNKIGGIFTSTAKETTKMFVTQFEFPYCNLYTSESTSADITIKLKVENAVKITETVLFDRTMRIDYIILEPVQ
jgi:hypothetical protein